MFKPKYTVPTDASQITAFLTGPIKKFSEVMPVGGEINRILSKKQSFISARSSDANLWSITFKENIPKNQRSQQLRVQVLLTLSPGIFVPALISDSYDPQASVHADK